MTSRRRLILLIILALLVGLGGLRLLWQWKVPGLVEQRLERLIGHRASVSSVSVTHRLELGAHDVGFTGIDWIRETNADVVEVMDLGFDRVRIVAAVPNEIDDKTLRTKRMIVATEYVNNAETWLKAQGLTYVIVRTHGAT